MALRASNSELTAPPADTAASLLAWYDRHHRDLPWRVSPIMTAASVRPDPYRVWLSEIMLQQTTVGAVKSYFDAFVRRWPTVQMLAAAETDEVMSAWAGLGYYSRARNLKKCADEIVSGRGGAFPNTEAGLKRLPGIGDYTAAAIAAIAFNRPAAVVDGNVERVVSRLRAIETPLPQAKPLIRAAVQALVPQERPGDFAQAMMDLGAMICTPRRPACVLCPVNEYCAAFALGEQDRFPLKAAKAERPHRRGAAFVALNRQGAVLLRKRSERGLLGGMAEVPTTGWSARADGDAGVGAAPFPAAWVKMGVVSHVFTHFSLDLAVYRAEADRAPPEGCWWSTPAAIPHEALPTVIKKVIEAAIPGATLIPDA